MSGLRNRHKRTNIFLLDEDLWKWAQNKCKQPPYFYSSISELVFDFLQLLKNEPDIQPMLVKVILAREERKGEELRFRIKLDTEKMKELEAREKNEMAELKKKDPDLYEEIQRALAELRKQRRREEAEREAKVREHLTEWDKARESKNQKEELEKQETRNGDELRGRKNE